MAKSSGPGAPALTLGSLVLSLGERQPTSDVSRYNTHTSLKVLQKQTPPKCKSPQYLHNLGFAIQKRFLRKNVY